jgi:hypothetical protein
MLLFFLQLLPPPQILLLLLFGLSLSQSLPLLHAVQHVGDQPLDACEHAPLIAAPILAPPPAAVSARAASAHTPYPLLVLLSSSLVLALFLATPPSAVRSIPPCS